LGQLSTEKLRNDTAEDSSIDKGKCVMCELIREKLNLQSLRSLSHQFHKKKWEKYPKFPNTFPPKKPIFSVPRNHGIRRDLGSTYEHTSQKGKGLQIYMYLLLMLLRLLSEPTSSESSSSSYS